ncbi:hypothetical protein SAMD00023353_1700480 [Rosellinia necatrix]|uniref:Uncharacterized protein n=1 Tax=Rosellinia necatrix TaxID=77044 RepID=A0A1W2TKT9_ROSNE|nr:hypothetical protein SAMD00023353_1700480 [Rosellinia necatrix]
MLRGFQVFWRAPASILGSLLAGVLMSVGHHLYYASFEGTPAEGDRIILGYKFSNQTFITAVGTTFALIVRAFLLFAVSGAYVQVFWHAATHARKVNTLGEIDAMFSILSSLIAFRHGSAWRKYPVLLLIALIAWLLPIAFTIPPASLSVRINTPVATSALETVPNFDFASLRYVDSMPRANSRSPGVANRSSDYQYEYIYNCPSIEVQKVASAVAAEGAILPITPPTPDSNWQLEFYGPSLSCYPMDDDTRLQVESHIAHYTWGTFPDCAACHCQEPFGYIAWSNAQPDESNPFSGLDPQLKGNQQGSSSFLAIMPGEVGLYEGGNDICAKSNLTTKLHPLGPGNRTFLQCDLHNSSYHAVFNYESGRQSIDVQVDRMEIVPVMDSIFLPNISDPVSGPASVHASLLRQLSYVAIADAFWQFIQGSVSSKSTSHELQINTTIGSTALLDTPELSFLSSRDWLSPLTSTLQGELWLTNTSKGQSLSSPRDVKPDKSLQNAMEEMFQNITMSLISSELLQPNATSEFAPPMPIVTTTTYKSTYQYSSRQLWIAYGVAIAVSSLASAVGLLAVFINDANYSNDFSSVYRTAHSSRLDAKIQAEDMKPADPLPEYLARAALYIGNSHSLAEPVPGGDDPQTAVATPTERSGEAPAQRGMEITEGEDDGSRSVALAFSTIGEVSAPSTPRIETRVADVPEPAEAEATRPVSNLRTATR